MQNKIKWSSIASAAVYIAAGIAPGMVRLSCGLENTEDLLADVEQALEQV